MLTKPDGHLSHLVMAAGSGAAGTGPRLDGPRVAIGADAGGDEPRQAGNAATQGREARLRAPLGPKPPFEYPEKPGQSEGCVQRETWLSQAAGSPHRFLRRDYSELRHALRHC